MPSQRKATKRLLQFWVEAELYEMFRKRAAELDATMTSLLIAYIEQETKHITLTEEDYERILQECRERKH